MFTMDEGNQIERFLAKGPATNAIEQHSACCYTSEDSEEEDLTDEEKVQQKRDQAMAEEQEYDSSTSQICAAICSDNSWLWKRWRIARFMESNRVKSFFAVLVMLNGVSIGVQADNDPDWIGWGWMEMVFIGFFSLELGVKLVAYQHLFWQVDAKLPFNTTLSSPIQ
jgi:hypothetical protein